MQNRMKSMVAGRMGKPLDSRLWNDKDYMESRERYHSRIEQVKEKLGGSQDGLDLVLKLDEAVGEYSGNCGEAAYIFGFHDGLEIGLEHGKQYGKDEQDGMDVPISSVD